MIQLELDVEMISREEFIGKIVSEFLEKISAPDMNNQLRGGAFRDHLVDTVYIRMLNPSDQKLIASIQVDIDYQKMSVNIAAFGAKVAFNPRQSSLDQASESIMPLIDFIRDYQKQTRAVYRLAFNLCRNNNEAEVMKVLGLENGKTLTWFSDEKKVVTELVKPIPGPGATYEFEITPAAFDEMCIRGQFIDPASLKAKEG